MRQDMADGWACFKDSERILESYYWHKVGLEAPSNYSVMTLCMALGRNVQRSSEAIQFGPTDLDLISSHRRIRRALKTLRPGYLFALAQTIGKDFSRAAQLDRCIGDNTNCRAFSVPMFKAFGDQIAWVVLAAREAQQTHDTIASVPAALRELETLLTRDKTEQLQQLTKRAQDLRREVLEAFSDAFTNERKV